MQKLARVSSKGQIIIPANIRKKRNISKSVLIKEVKGKIILEPAKSFEESFGDRGEEEGKLDRFADAIKIDSPPIRVKSVERKEIRSAMRYKFFKIVLGSAAEEVLDGFSSLAAHFEFKDY